jgi:micrococcal nuclease
VSGTDTSSLLVATTTAEVVEVIDGDTIRVRIQNEVESVRYIGIDTPEPYRDGLPECFSLEASLRNQDLVTGQEVALVRDEEDRDKYNRLLRYVYLDGVLINEVLVQEGYAKTLTIPPNNRFATHLRSKELEARRAGRGLWGVCE